MCVGGYRDYNCTEPLDNDFYAILEGTAGAIKQVNWNDYETRLVRSIKYLNATTENTTNCTPILFDFINERNSSASNWLLVTPGQQSQDCIAIHEDEPELRYWGVTLVA